MDPEVMEIAPPVMSNSKRKQKQVADPEVIDVEQYKIYDGGVTIFNKIADPKNKGKGILVDADPYVDHLKDFAIDTSEPSNDTGYQLGTSPSHDLFEPDSFVYEDDDEYYDQFGEDLMNVDDGYSMYQDLFDSKNLPTDVEVPIPWFPNSTVNNKTDQGGGSNSSHSSNKPVAQDSPAKDQRNVEDYLGKFVFFKKFDTVEDYSDHFYAYKGLSIKQPSKDWAKRIQEEWRILENDLPETIFVRVCESRMDLLRAVIIGAEGTPYHDGLFFFDVLFPDRYPNEPPKVHYHSGGLRINPNLYNCGKVCLSLLGTWSGAPKERWLPGVSTMLQVLVSIQALILNQKPYFNEPGYERTMGTPEGEHSSEQYSENAFLLSLKTMIYNMKRPPKHFEDFVYGHFFSRAHDILAACKAYKEGAPVACLVKGGVQDVEESTKTCSKRCSKKFSSEVADFIGRLVEEFSKIGVKGTENFLK